MGYFNDLYKIFPGTVTGDKTGTPAKVAGQGINANMDRIDSALEAINAASEKTANKVTTLDAANNTTYPTSQTVKAYMDGKEVAANNFTTGQLVNYQAKSEKNQPNGYMGLDANGIALAANLPVSVDEIIEGAYIDANTFNNALGNPVVPAKAKIYMDVSVNPVKQYRWGGSTFGEINPNAGLSDEIAEGNVNLYFTGARVLATVLTGLNTLTALAVSSGDSILVAIGKLQAQFNTIATSIGNKLEKGTYNGTAGDLKTLIDQKETPLNAQSKADTAESNAKAYADGLLKAGVGKSYLDIPALLADQDKQSLNGIYEVLDASGDPTVVGGYAYYKNLGIATAALEDYRKLSEEESMDIGGGVTQAYVDAEVATAKQQAIDASKAYTDAQVAASDAWQTRYADIAALIAGQAVQKTEKPQFVFDASGDPTVQTGWATYILKDLAVKTGQLSDYRKLSEQESLDVAAASSGADIRLSNVAADLNTAEKDAIKAKLGIQEEIDKLGAAIVVSASRNFAASDNGKILMITAPVILTMVSAGLQNAFRCDLDCTSTGQATIAKDAGAVILNFPAGQILEAGKMGTIYRKPVGTYPNEYRGKGEFKV